METLVKGGLNFLIPSGGIVGGGSVAMVYSVSESRRVVSFDAQSEESISLRIGNG